MSETVVESNEKWKCKFCTYENFPSSIKCTMCEHKVSKNSNNTDIYQIASAGPSIISDKDIHAHQHDDIDSENIANKNKNRTNLEDTAKQYSHNHYSSSNKDQSSKDQTCSTKQSKTHKQLSQPSVTDHLPPSSVTASNIHEQLDTLKIDNTTTSTNTVRSSQLSLSPSEELDSSNRKWCCARCTYENWPKANKCIMCNGSPRISPHHGSSPELDRENASARCILDDRDRYERRSTPRERRDENSFIFNNKQSTNNYEIERRLRAHRHLQRSADWAWLNACVGIVQGDYGPVHSYLSCGGNPSRQLTAPEVALLNRPSAFDVGHTLVHLAIRFQREDILATLLSQIEGSGGSGVKRVPSYVAPDLAADIRRQVANTIRQRKASFPCPFVTEINTFTLPAEIEDLPPSIQEQLFEELLDKDAQQQLESEPHPVINWSLEVTVHLSSRLYALWNRSAGDCLLDSLMQTTWGVFDRENILRRALSDSLNQAGHLFYPRWKEYEDMQATLLDFSLDEAQWEDDWTTLISLASQPGAALEQLHVFALAHILRRPIIVYGVKYVKSFRGEDIGYARFEGVYLPLLWDPSFCSRSPLSLGYTRGHFSALIPIEPYSSRHHQRGGGARNIVANENQVQVTFLPLMDHERKLLPIHFVTHNEIGREEDLLKQWLDVGVTESGLLVAQQTLTKPPLLVAQMVEEWLNHYRRLQQMSTAPFSRPLRVQDFSSDDSDGDE